MPNRFLKSIFKNTVVRMIVALTLVGVASGATLVFIYNYAVPKIKNNQNRERSQAIRNIFPGLHGTSVKKKTKDPDESIFEATDKDGKLLGYAFIATGNGYQGEIKLMVGIDPDLTKLHGFEVLESQETPGLGAEIAGKDFRKQFRGLSVSHSIEYVKNQKPAQPYQIEAITGATISSRAVVNLLNKRIDQVREELKGGK